MENMLAIRRPVRNRYFWVGPKSTVIPVGNPSSGSNIFIQMFQFDLQDSSLYRIQTAITAHYIMIIAFALAMVGNHLQFACQHIVFRHHSAPVPITSQVLGWEK